MSATAVATTVTTRASGRPPRRPGPPAMQSVSYPAHAPLRSTAHLALRAVAYTAAAVLGLGGVPAAMALLEEAGVFAGMFAL
jgi:hypothetical protein